jgi:transitional endoplasmic reticulum ATPase
MAQAPAVPEKNIWDSIDTKIVYTGKTIVLPGDPKDMPIQDAIKTLKRIEESENQRYDVQELVEGAPWDALVAIAKAMHQIYGVVIAESIQTFFGEIKPKLITINTGPEPEDNIQVAMGQMSIPNVTAPVQISLHRLGSYITGTVRRKDRSILVEIATLARKIMKEDSIYKGKAIKLRVDDDGQLTLTEQPEFIQLKGVEETDIIHTRNTMRSIKNNIYGPLKHTAACRAHKIPLKRGILLEGKYGTGKSLTARVTAKVAVDNGWTFIMLDKSQGLGAAIEFARTYQPCVIFAEDIDRAADREDEDVNTLVNLLDGLITKDMEMMVVLTTNFIDKIDKALLRPGRFDAVISIEAPDSETAIRVIRHYARSLITEGTDLTEVGNILTDQIPATIREVVERAKVLMLMEERECLVPEDLLSVADDMAKHIALLNPKIEIKSAGDRLFDILCEAVQAAGGIDTQVIDGLTGEMSRVRGSQSKLARVVSDKLEETNSFAQAAAGSAETANETSKRVLEVGRETLDTSRVDLKTTEKVLKAVTG